MAIEFTPITELPTPPTKASPANFATLADIFLAALPNLATEINTALVEMNNVTSGLDQTEPIVAYSASTTYDYPDVCAGSDGHTYRCIGTSVLADNPVGSVTGDWVALSQDIAALIASYLSSYTTSTDSTTEIATALGDYTETEDINTALGLKLDADDISSYDTNAKIATALGLKLTASAISSYDTNAKIAAALNLKQNISSAFGGVVTQRSTRTSTGTWTITGLTVGKPLILTATIGGSFEVTSGAVASNVSEFIIQSTAGAAGTSQSSVHIPTSSTVTISFSILGGTWYAYQ